jgi:hypothetical protein
MDQQTVDTLITGIQDRGFESVLLQRNSTTLQLNAVEGIRPITLKIRREKRSAPKEDSLFIRELDCYHIAGQRHPRSRQVMPTLVYTDRFGGGQAAAARIFLGGSVYSVISVERLGVDGNHFKAWFDRQLYDNDHECPDDVRDLMAQLLGTLSDLERKLISLGGFGPENITFIPGPEMRIIFTDAGSAVVDHPHRQYVERGILQAQSIETTPSSTDGPATFKSVLRVEVEKTLANRQLRILAGAQEICELGSHPSTHDEHRIADAQSAAIIMCSLLLRGDGELDLTKLEELKRAESISNFARSLNWRDTDQKRSMARVFSVVQDLLNDKVRPAVALMRKGAQYPILTNHESRSTLGSGLRVPGGVVPFSKDKNTGEPLIAPEIVLVDRIATGKGLGAETVKMIKKDAFVTYYPGQYESGRGWFSKYAAALNRGFDRVVWRFSSRRSIKRAIAEKSVGHMLNSSRIIANVRRKGNVGLMLDEAFEDENGLRKIPMYALRDILPGEELVWDYDFLAGRSGDLYYYSPDEDEMDGTCTISTCFNTLRIFRDTPSDLIHMIWDPMIDCNSILID